MTSGHILVPCIITQQNTINILYKYYVETKLEGGFILGTYF